MSEARHQTEGGTGGPSDGAAGDVACAARGDGAAVRRLWHQHRRWVAAVLLAHKPREAELEDLLQEVAMTLVSKVHELRDESSLKPWLRTVALNTARASGRRVSRERGRRSAGAFEPDAQPGEISGAAPDAAMHQRDEASHLLSVARELPEGYREPLLMRCVRGMSYREIGRVLELPETTIETRIARGRRMLRQRVTELERRADRIEAEAEA